MSVCGRAAGRFECCMRRPGCGSSSTAARPLSPCWRPRRHLLPSASRQRADRLARAGSGRSINWVRECDGTFDEDVDEEDEEDEEAMSNGSNGSNGNGTQASLAAAASVGDPDADRLDAQVEALQSQLDALREATLMGADSSEEVLDLEQYTDTYSIDDVQELKAQIDNLKAVVFKQRELIRNLQSAANARIPPGTAIIAGAAALSSSSSSSSVRTSSSPSPSAGLISPFGAWEGTSGPRGAPPPISDRRHLGGFDARFHSTSAGATPKDFRVLPARIILVRHGQSYEDNDQFEYSSVPDPRIPLTDLGREQAKEAGVKIRQHLGNLYSGKSYRTFFYTSPYLRSSQTFESLREGMFDTPLDPAESQPLFVGMREEVQLREQDFGNFQDSGMKMKKRNERKRYGRFFYRFPNGESGADLYDRITIFQDHLIRDINAGRFSNDTTLVLITHGLAMRVFLMRWFHWTVDQLLAVENPRHAEPLVLERVPGEEESRPDGPVAWMHTKSLYRLDGSASELLKGCTEDMMTASSPLYLTPRSWRDSDSQRMR